MLIPRQDAFAPTKASPFLSPSKTISAAVAIPTGLKSAGNWSSLIGIVTAIVGNILISFALNTQRYAHIKLEREQQDAENRRKKRQTDGLYGSYGTTDVERESNGRARTYGQADAAADGNGEQLASQEDDFEHEAREDEPLLSSEVARGRASPDLRSMSTLRDLSPESFRFTNKQKSYLHSPSWWTGIIMMTVGEAGNFLAYGFAPASIVSPLGVVALISNCIIAPVMFKEPFRWRDGVGVVIAVAGAVTVVASANSDNPKLGPGTIWSLITTWEFETYFAITVVAIIILMAVSRKYGRKSIFIDLGLVGLFGA
jgi:magnesium transporter